MVLALFTLTLVFTTSCQQENTEKMLSEMLDQLIEETVMSTFSEEIENNSSIIYIKPDNITNTRNHAQESRLNIIHASDYKDLENLVNQIENSKHETNPKQSDENTFAQGLTVEIERTGAFDNDLNDGEANREINIVNSGFSKSGRPLFEDIHDEVTASFASESGSNLVHKYPEVIIEKNIYDASENNNDEKDEEHRSFQENNVSLQKNSRSNINDYKEVHKEVAAKALDSLMKILKKAVPKKKSIDASNGHKDDMNAILKPTHIHNDFHNHVINNVPLAYSRDVLLGKLPDAYRNLHSVINRPRSAYIDQNLQLNRWGANAGQNCG